MRTGIHKILFGSFICKHGKIAEETTETINRLKQQSLDIFDDATAAELTIFELFGETPQTLSYMEEMKNVAKEAASSFSRLSTLQLQVAHLSHVRFNNRRFC